MPSRVPCFRCGTDATGDDDFENCYLGDVYPDLCERNGAFDGHVDLCEKCKQGLDTVVERYLKQEKEPQAPEFPGLADMDKKMRELSGEQ